jgi:D-alanyl-D-alanine carboxypeptidase
VTRWIRVLSATTGGFVVGALFTLAVQAWRGPAPALAHRPPGASGLSAIHAESPTTFLAWVPGGLPAGFGASVRRSAELRDVTVVAEDDAWLVRSWDAGGELVDHPPKPYRIPLDTAAVDPRTFAPFLPPSDQARAGALSNGLGILGASSASLRGLGPGSVIAFPGGVQVQIASVLPDELVGAAELVVSKRVGRRLGVEQERYLLARPRHLHGATSKTVKDLLRPMLPHSTGSDRLLQVRAPGETPYFRAGDAVLPPVLVKALFGEFAARQMPRRPGDLQVDPAWTQTHIETTTVPVLGRVTCNRGIVPQLTAAMQELKSRGLAELIRTYHGCFVPRFIGRSDANMISFHTWGVAFDINLAGNLHGEAPHEDPRLVRTLERWGFAWGGTWLLPDGSHFEYHRPPE